ncbi:MAG: type II secretion system protein GspN [Polyangiaceae bacterium]
MKAFLRRAAKYVLYPLFYLVCLVVFLYLTFPWDALKNKLIAEFAKGQASKGEKAWRLEIAKLSGYWFTGVELEGVRIIMPAVDEEEEARKKALAKASGGDTDLLDSPDASAPSTEPAADKAKDGEKHDKPTESVMTITSAHARAQILPLLVGKVRIDFDAQAFGGEVRGQIPIAGGTLTVDVKDVDFGQVAPLRELVGLPVKGIANGHMDFTSDANGKWAKANGGLDLTVTDVILGDGKAKLLNKATLPPAKIGTLEISGKATNGVFVFEKFGATGKDVELIGAGNLRLRDPWDNSQLDFIIRFGFSDAFRVSDPKVTGLLGDPNPDPNDIVLPPGIELDKRIKKGKRADGMYGLSGKGPLKKLKWDGTTEDSPAKPAGAADSDASASSAPATPPTTPKKPPKKPAKTTTPAAPAPNPEPKTPEPTPAPTPDPPKQQFPTQPVPEPAPTPAPQDPAVPTPQPPQEEPPPPQPPQ